VLLSVGDCDSFAVARWVMGFALLLGFSELHRFMCPFVSGAGSPFLRWGHLHQTRWPREPHCQHCLFEPSIAAQREARSASRASSWGFRLSRPTGPLFFGPIPSRGSLE
jgi:hypothetical protein